MDSLGEQGKDRSPDTGNRSIGLQAAPSFCVAHSSVVLNDHMAHFSREADVAREQVTMRIDAAP